MKILLIGSGGREHALAFALSKSKSLTKLFASPANPGILEFAEDAHIDAANFDDIVDFCKVRGIDLVVCGPEQPLAIGLADKLAENQIACFGPKKFAANLEASKSFSKDFMKKFDIPTAAYQNFDKNEAEQAHLFIDKLSDENKKLVIKADGLAGGKGVVLPESREEAHLMLNEIFEGAFGSSGNRVVIEEFMEGLEASIFAICDGNDFITLAPAQDHKRVADGDLGKNTGGMGAYCPAPIVSEKVLEQVKNEIIKPVLKGMKELNSSYIGCLFVGLMIENDYARVVEFNCRFGDPETQSVLSLFEGDFAKLLHSAALGNLDKSAYIENNDKFACNVVLASDGYPDSFQKGFPIIGIEDIDKSNSFVFQAGTKLENDNLISNGGRVLAVNGIGSSLKEAIDNAYAAVSKISFENMYFRKDIGQKGLN